ncbi:LPXTG cell wall anchor domain-containing protein [Lactobacillus sp. YT155]|uniref:LPXTG cell wall anchor domain-containing protein n=1 Tax=Lactobacillus sp. YT155 TaxID=3060955 RepID=UPI00265E5E36|nr:LPXTG cell wall anchor domain-containing protein [Lactobacillus sp. YT155]MDO1605325.1 LPXTG cell wall anchor domain-containing protein [Lactobacillus sp. YT155]
MNKTKGIIYSSLILLLLLPTKSNSSAVAATSQNSSDKHIELAQDLSKSAETPTVPALTYDQFEANSYQEDGYFSRAVWSIISEHLRDYKGKNIVIPQSAFDEIKTFRLQGNEKAGVYGLKGVEYLHGLVTVDLGDQIHSTDAVAVGQEEIDRFSEITSIQKFTSVNDWALNNINFMRKMNLIYINIDGSDVFDLSPLADIARNNSEIDGIELNASNMGIYGKHKGISDESLEKITNVPFKTLNLNYDKITDNGVENLSKLVPPNINGEKYPEFNLGLEGNEIYDVIPLSKLIFDNKRMDKTFINIQHNHILDISPLINFSNEKTREHVNGKSQNIYLNDSHFARKYDVKTYQKYVFPNITDLDGEKLIETTDQPKDTYIETNNEDGTHSYEWTTDRKKVFHFQSIATNNKHYLFDGTIVQMIGKGNPVQRTNITAHFVLKEKNGEKLSEDKVSSGEIGDSYLLKYSSSMKEIIKNGKAYDLKAIIDGKEKGLFSDSNQDIYYIYEVRSNLNNSQKPNDSRHNKAIKKALPRTGEQAFSNEYLFFIGIGIIMTAGYFVLSKKRIN